jgi:hypothetical protein
MEGAAVATVVSYTLMFAGMTVNAQRVYRVPYQWRRAATAVAAAVALALVGTAFDPSLALAVAMTLAYPIVLLPLRFYLPAELRIVRRFVPIAR